MPDQPQPLASYLPAFLLRQLATDATPLSAPQIRHFPAAILFADITGFTALAERLNQMGAGGVETLSQVLNNFFDQLITLISEHGGDIVKFAGDAVLAVWPTEEAGGQPSTLAASLTRAAQCALALQTRLHRYPALEGVQLAMRMGLGAGPMTLMQIGGVFGRWEAVLLGEPIAQASRAEGRAQPGEVIIAPEAWGLAQDNLEVALLNRAEQKQALRLLQIHTPLALNPTHFAPLAPAAENAARAYVPGAILRRLAAGQTDYLAELRHVTVMFVNLRGFEQLATLEQAQQLLQTAQRALYRYEGSVNQFLMDDKGTTLLAAFGLPPFAHEDDAARGVLAALELRTGLNALGLTQVGIGLASGQAYCGERGNARRREYALVGDVVNLAARLMQKAIPNAEIFCDEATYHGAQQRVAFTPLPPVTVKGKTAPIPLYRPMQEKKMAARTRGELVGRQRERTTLAQMLHSLQRGERPGVVLIEGEAGIGKSRLSEDLRHQALNMALPVFVGAGDALERSAYTGWRAIFGELFGLTRVASTATRQARLLAYLNALAKTDAALGESVLALAPLLNPVLGLEIPETARTAPLTGVVRADSTRELLMQLLRVVVVQLPIVVILEDAHWLDEASWALGWEVSEQLPAWSLLFVLTTRPLSEAAPSEYRRLCALPYCTKFNLQAFTLADTTTFISQRLGVRTLPAEVAQRLHHRAEGNPFFTEELLAALREANGLEIQADVCHLTAQAETQLATLPDTVQGSIASRIDRLAPPEQLTLKVASVIGRIFPISLLQAIYPLAADRPALPNHLLTLEQQGFIVRLLNMEEQYNFKHAITHEVAYNLMLFAQRRQLHRVIAEWYTTEYGDQPMFYAKLAHHWREALAEAKPNAQALQQTLFYLEKAGEEALRNGVHQEAIRWIEEALQLAKIYLPQLPPPRRAHWLQLLGKAYYDGGQLAAARPHLEAALATLGVPTHLSWRMGLATISQLAQHLWLRLRGWPLPQRLPTPADAPVLDVLQGALTLATLLVLSDEISLVSVYVLLHSINLAESTHLLTGDLAALYAALGYGCLVFNQPQLAARYYARAHQIAQQLADPTAQATVALLDGIHLVTRGAWTEATQLLNRAAAHFGQMGDDRSWGMSYLNLAFIAAFRYQTVEWASLNQRLYKRAKNSADVEHQAGALAGLAINHTRRGQLTTALQLFEQAAALYAQIPASQLSAQVHHSGLALAHLRLGQPAEALAQAEHTRSILRQQRLASHPTLLSQQMVAEVLLTCWEYGRQPPPKKQAAQTCQALHLLARAYPVARPAAWLWQGVHHYLQNRWRPAQQAWHKSLAYAQALAMPHEQGLAHYWLGRTTRHAEHLQQACAIFEQLGLPYELARAKAALASNG